MKLKTVTVSLLCLLGLSFECTVLAIDPVSGGVSVAESSERKTSASKKLAGKTIVITGASSGFGRGVALKLAAEGANLVLASRRLDSLQKLAKDCGGDAVVVAVKADVGNYHDVEQIAVTALERFKRIDVWINDAGVGAIGRFVDIPIEDHTKVIQTDLLGVIYGSHVALRQFEIQKEGTLINVSSIVGAVPTAYYSSYSAAKLGVAGLDKALSAELKADNYKKIHVCTVYPMPTDTPFWKHAANYTNHSMQPPLLQRPDRVVNAIAELVTKPKSEVFFGSTAKMGVSMHNLNSELVEDYTAKTIFHQQIKTNAPAVEPTDGAVLKPMSGDDTVEGGVAERMKSEKKLAK